MARYRAVIGEGRLPGNAERLQQVLQSGMSATERCAWTTQALAADAQGVGYRHCIDFLYQPLRNEQGQVTGVFVEGTEVTERVQAEAQLRESQAHFKAALNAGRMGSWETDHRNKVRQWSEEGMALFGLELAGGRGKVDGPDDEYAAAIHPDDRHLVQRFRHLAAELDSFPAEYRIVRPDGSTVWLSGRGLVVERGADGQPLRLVSVMGDATARKVAEEQLRTERERLALALSAGQMGAYDYDIAADRLWWSPETYALFGVHPAQFVPTPESVIGLLHPEDRARFLRSRTDAQARRQPLAIEFRILRGDGRTAWLAHRGQMEYDAQGHALRSFGISMDVTEARESAEQLRALSDRLSDADRRKDEFLATLAHELRNPLAPVRNSLELMKRVGNDVQAMQRLRSTIERQIHQMVRLIDDLLDIGRINSNKLELRCEPVELGAILRQAIETSSAAVAAGGHTLRFEPAATPTALNADPVRLNQVFTNLIVNAAKFTPTPATIELRTERRDGQAIVSVADPGIGIPPGMLEQVFEPFVQVDTTIERARGGLGLGLSLVKRLVELHGGSAHAHSDGAGRGSRFEVRLPCDNAAAAAPVALQQVDAAASLPPSVILIADDNQDGAESLALLLGLEGHDTHTVYDGLQAVAVAGQLQPDVVLLDIGMPKMSGHDACATMRRQAWGRRALIIATTGWGQADDRRRSEAAGFDAHLIKPVDAAELMRTLTRLRIARSEQGRPG